MAVAMSTDGVARAYARWAPVYDVVFGPVFRRGRERGTRFGLSNVEAIAVDDAENLSFPDNAFDVVVAQYVVTAVPRPERALDEFARVCRPGGEIVITTRVSADGGLRGAIEKGLMPVTSRLGFRTEFPFARYTDWAARRRDVVLAERRALPPLGHFSLVRFVKLAAAPENDR